MSLIQTPGVIAKQDGRQDVKSMDVRFDFTAAGASLATHAHLSVFTIPAGARVIGGEVVVDIAGVGPATSTLDIGDGGVTDRYTPVIINLKATAGTVVAITASAFRYVETDGIDFEIINATTGPLTAGQWTVRMEYVIEGRTDDIQE